MFLGILIVSVENLAYGRLFRGSPRGIGIAGVFSSKFTKYALGAHYPLLAERINKLRGKKLWLNYDGFVCPV